MTEARAPYGVLAAYADAEQLCAAVQALRSAGYRTLETFTPFAVPGLAEQLDLPPVRLPRWALLGGTAGALLSYLLQYYSAVYAYPLNIGGRPLHSWPAFLPVSIEFAIFGAAAALAVGFLIATGLPRLRHPLFAVPGFERATQDRFFVCVRAGDAQFAMDAVQDLLHGTAALSVQTVPA